MKQKTMSYTLSQITEALGAKLEGNATQGQITGINTLKSSKPGEISFLTNAKYSSEVKETKASAVICSMEFKGLPKEGTAALRCSDPHMAYAKALELFYKPPKYAPNIHPTASIDPTSRIGANAHVGPYAVIGPTVTIGANCVILAHVTVYQGVTIGNEFFAHSHAVIRENCRIGDRVVIQNGVILGGDGFGFAQDKGTKRWHKIPQTGILIIDDDVEIQSNTCIDRAALGEARIERGVKIDNLVQIGHGCNIGENTLLISQVGLAGSTEIGKNSILAGQVGVVGHLRIGDNVVVTAQSGIPGDVPDGSIVSGSPAFDNKQWLRAIALFQKLPELAKKVKALGNGDKEE